ncbi:tyrosine-protein phosphatase [Sinomonas atrocyanea]|nr:tyrosine-protein phosphatase [Sinomonas atrocyanea]
MNEVTLAATRDGLRLEGVRNFRDLGGMPAAGGLAVRRGVLFRSGHLGRVSAADRQKLDERGVRFIDLRQAWEAEIEDRVGPLGPGTASYGRPAEGGLEQDAPLWTAIRRGQAEQAAALVADAGAEEAMIRLYSADIAGDPAPYAGFLASLVRGSLPAVVHCSAGKDRTGWAVAVLLTALGTPEVAILEDYALSSLPANQYVLRTPAGHAVPIEGTTKDRLDPLLEARPAYLQAAWKSVERTWGSRNSYLEHGLGITPPVLAALRTRLLDGETAQCTNPFPYE